MVRFANIEATLYTHAVPGEAIGIAYAGNFVRSSCDATSDLNHDIETFIETELEACIMSKRLVVGDPNIVLEIQDALVTGSEGMFLWVALQIASLCSMESDYAIRQALADLPKDLSEAFSRTLQKPERSERTYRRLIFELLIAAVRPLTTEEFREALSVITGDINWNSDKLLNDVMSTLSCCGGLVIIDE